jgi:hypothetical protein
MRRATLRKCPQSDAQTTAEVGKQEKEDVKTAIAVTPRDAETVIEFT